MQTSKYEVLKIKSGKAQPIDDHLVIEAALEIDINKEPYTVVMRTPGDDEELIRGLLYAEDIYKGLSNLNIETLKESENGFSILNVNISKSDLGKGYLNKRTLLSVSSCGICGKQKLEDISLKGKAIAVSDKIALDRLPHMFALMKSNQRTFEITGGSHAAAVFDKNHQLLTLKEDIGRHNAVDKAIGDLLNNKQLKEAKFLLVSGRVSYEIISKAFLAKIPIIAAVSACSTLAVDYAKEFGICLIGFSRDNKATIYTNPSYIK